MQGRRPDTSRRQQARLPPIAPRHEAAGEPSGTLTTASGGSGSRGGGGGGSSIDVPRTRLPPRSRSGCWTCRTRIKCDEQRPTCGQCTRLRHTCDYNPRLAFKDDTPRVVERMQDVSTTGSTVWDPRAPGLEYNRTDEEDVLPPFAALTTDEDRERKAQLQNPGTYHVIANPSSFAHLPEYAEDESHLGLPALALDDGDDPNVVILKTFEETMRRPDHSPTGQSSTPVSMVALPAAATLSLESQDPHEKLSQLDLADRGDHNHHLLAQYRSYISPLIIPTARPGGIDDFFEAHARTFPPLFHAMMALSALSLTQRRQMQHAEALEHYEKVIPAMRATVQSSQDSFSDGALLTHFLLLLYEIAALGHWESSMWREHIQQLLRIVTLRRQMQGLEPHAYVVWWICVIDIHALLTATGDGSFVQAIIDNNMMPAAYESLVPMYDGRSAQYLPEETRYFPLLLQLNQTIVLMSFRTGRLARDLRREAAHRQFSEASMMGDEHMYALNVRQRVLEMQGLLRGELERMRGELPDELRHYDDSLVLPPRVLCYFEHSYTLIRAVIIYSCTSMYAGQLLEQPLTYNGEVAQCVREILHVGSHIVATKRFQLRFILFPLFVAGYASQLAAEKMLALNLLKSFEQNSSGGSISAIIQLLTSVYEKQQVEVNANGVTTLDWVDELQQRGMQLVTFVI